MPRNLSDSNAVLTKDNRIVRPVESIFVGRTKKFTNRQRGVIALCAVFGFVAFLVLLGTKKLTKDDVQTFEWCVFASFVNMSLIVLLWILVPAIIRTLS